jgi:hypothetical protein
MIALPSRLPLLQIGDFCLTDYDAPWLAESIRHSAAQNGQQDWWIADDIARGVISFLRHRYSSTVITVEQLSQKVAEVLSRIGFPEVAEHLHIGVPRVSLDLMDVMREAERLEMLFFQLLEARLASLRATGVQHICVASLAETAKLMSGNKHWCAAAAQSREEIVVRIRHMLPQKVSLLSMDKSGAMEELVQA